VRATWLVLCRTYSCATAPDLHRLRRIHSLFSCEKDCMPWLGIRQWLSLGQVREHIADDWGRKQTDQIHQVQAGIPGDHRQPV